jgi:hypothetical protein
VASSIVSAVFFAVALRHRLAVGVGPDEGSLFEAATDGLAIE